MTEQKYQLVLALFADVRAAVARKEVGQEIWLDLIQRAQALPGDISWMGCFALVQMAGLREATAAAVKEAALGLYEAQALAGEEESTRLLWNYAQMAGDSDLLARFAFEMKLVTHAEEEEARSGLPESEARLREAVGIGPEYDIEFLGVVPIAELVYRRDRQAQAG